MKKHLQLLFVACTALFVGCQTEPIDVNYSGEGVSSLTISIPETKTALGNKVDGIYSVSWSEGDCIVANGVKSSEAVINTSNPGSATFNFGTTLNYPLKVTYPYTSTSTANSPKVVVPTEQDYVANSFAPASAPMCGYVESKSDKVMMTHLAGVLRFPIKASVNGTVLDRIVITSTDGAKLSGEFAVDCANATLTATENGSNTITYLLPDNFTLSTSTESVFYISVPAGEPGVCTVEFIEPSGDKMTNTWRPKSVKNGIVREFKTITYRRGVIGGALESMGTTDDELEFSEQLGYYDTVYGYVKDTSGNPISGVAVSDGFSVTATDSKGFYTLTGVTADCNYIYISVPSEYEIPINEFGQPCFYKKFEYLGTTPQYDFTLTPLADGKEKKFALVTFADPQVGTNNHLNRFQNEAIPGISKYIKNELVGKGIPCYGITLGDIIWNNSSRNSGSLRDDLRDGFSVSSMGLPVFQVMGNHDNTFFNDKHPLQTDERSSTLHLKAQREHEDIFGPANYSFNRGDVHIVGMRDVLYKSDTDPGDITSGFTYEQLVWLSQDLSHVPLNKMVVLCVHIQMLNNAYGYKDTVLQLLNKYREAHIMSGHMHIQYNYGNDAGYKKVYEHNSCSVCGNLWGANIATDGTPNGFNVFIGEGNTFSDWYYMGYHDKMNTRDYQMRLYRGNTITGAAISGDNNNGTKGYYSFNYGEDYLLANVFNAYSDWEISVYENGQRTGLMTNIERNEPDEDKLIGSFTKADPRRFDNGVACSYEMFATGLYMGVMGRTFTATGSTGRCYHLYKYRIRNKNATIKVVAKDPFGNVYECDDIIEEADYSYAYTHNN